MKQIVIILFLLVGGQFHLNASVPISNAIAFLDDSESKEEFEYSLQLFEEILETEKDNWLVYYYAAFSLVKIELLVDKNEIDFYAERAESFLDKAEELSEDNAEIFCLRALIISAKIRVNKKKRGFRFVTLSNALLKKSKNLDANNPRADYLLGMNTLNIPSFLGGGKWSALKHFVSAKKNFKFESNTCRTLLPHWGEEKCNSMISKINNNEI